MCLNIYRGKQSVFGILAIPVCYFSAAVVLLQVFYLMKLDQQKQANADEKEKDKEDFALLIHKEIHFRFFFRYLLYMIYIFWNIAKSH